ncbi:MAG: transposase [Bacillota bacterium]
MIRHQRPGDQIKNDRRDARKLARHLRNRDLTPVWVPDEDNEALRDLSRTRQSLKEDASIPGIWFNLLFGRDQGTFYLNKSSKE